jgi:hypothetical protein
MRNCILIGELLMLFVLINVNCSIFITETKMNKMLELNARKPHCRIHTERGHVSKIINNNLIK